MEQITLRIPDDLLESLEEEADEHGVSRSECIRDVLDSRNEHDEIRDEYESRIDELQAEHEEHVEELEDELESVRAERDDLQRQLAAANQRIDANNELVEYVREERTLERKRAEAGIIQRAKWWVTGMDAEGD